MMQKLLFLILMTTYCIFSYAQDTYFKTLQLYGESFSSPRCIKSAGNGFYLSANTLCTEGLDSFNCLSISRHDEFGDVVWERRFPWARSANQRNISLKGDTIICNAHAIPGESINTYHILLLNTDGDSLFSKSWNYTQSQFNQEGAYSNGHVTIGDEVFMYGMTTNHADSIIGLIQKYNLHDSTEATITYHTPIGNTFPGWDMQVDKDSNLVVLNSIDRFTTNFTAVIKELLLLDRDGTILSRTYGPNYNLSSQLSDQFILLDDGNYLFINTVDNPWGNQVPQVVSMFPNGDIKWKIDFPLIEPSNDIGRHYVNEITKANNGDILLMGVYARSWNLPGHVEDIFIMRVSPQGETLWRRYYNTPYLEGTEYLNTYWSKDIQELGDQSILVVGRAFHHNDLVILRVDENGCLDGYNCDDQIIVGSHNLSDNKISDTSKVFPNPTQGVFSISTNQPISGILKIYNLGGQLLESHNLQHQQSIDLDLREKTKGVYLVHIYDHRGMHEVQKIVVY